MVLTFMVQQIIIKIVAEVAFMDVASQWIVVAAAESRISYVLTNIHIAWFIAK